MRIPTGIPGLDELIQGGFLEGATILVSGGPGTGKTIFGLQYIYKGAEYGDPGIFISMEEGPTNLWWNIRNFRWNFAKYEQEGLVKLYQTSKIGPEEFARKFFEEEIPRIKEIVEEMNAKRLVLDSTTAFAMWMGSEAMIRYGLFRLADELKELKCTTILTAETLGQRDQFSRFGVEEFVCDGVIVLYFMPPTRAIFIRKMRGTKHDQKVHPYEITDDGIVVYPKEEILWESLKR